MSKKAQKEYAKGLGLVESGDFEEATLAFEKAVAIDDAFVEAHIRIGAISFQQNKLEKSRIHLTRALDLQPDRKGSIPLTLGRISWQEAKYAEVETWIKEYLQQPRLKPELKQEAEKLLRDAAFMLMASEPNNIRVDQLPATINSDLPEYLPALSADQTIMVFTRRIQGQEDFFISQRENGEWLEAQPLNELNTRENEGAHCLSADGTLLIFTACNRGDGHGSCDLYFSKLEEGRWSRPMNMGPEVNSSAWDSQPSLSANGRHLYFASQRNGGVGKRDIWVTKRTANGWSAPTNVTKVNSPHNEEAPFLHADLQTMYFMSDGHPGFGGTDLFVTRYINQQWTIPQNLGSPLNTSENEGALHITLAGTHGYFARTTDDDINIFEFELPIESRPTPATYARIQTLDGSTGIPLSAIVKVYDLSNEILFEYSRSDSNGRLLLCMTVGRDYGIQVNHPGYIFYSANVNLEEATNIDQPHDIEAAIWPLTETLETDTTDRPIVLRNVFFESGEATLMKKSYIELDRLRDLLTENAEMWIEIRGHTDEVGSSEDNMILSEDRAQAVYQYLLQQGISAHRLQYRGFGEGQPIASNTTSEGRALNRRTEFVVIRTEE